ncbi:MAG TPA: hypothetical protein VK425_12895 [Acidimicrobiales bacterium]|nr:hypothetical protein [Acidimicrobiales bacterium]
MGEQAPAASQIASLEPPTAFAGHSTMSVALTYQHATKERQREMADKMDEVLRRRPAVAPVIAWRTETRNKGEGESVGERPVAK